MSARNLQSKRTSTMRQRYQYMLFGLYGEWLGITAHRSVALAHKARGDWA